MKDNIVHINGFIKTLSAERFERYLVFVDRKQELALRLYDINASLSQAMYVPLQALEVTLRNSIHTCLSERERAYWFDCPDFLRSGNQTRAIGEVKARLIEEKKPVEPGRIVAGLSFGFWTGMFGPPYEELWRSHLHGIVQDKTESLTRRSFSGPLGKIRKLRNRIVHHECIIGWRLKDCYSEVDLILKRISPEAQNWMERNSTFDKVYGGCEAFLNSVHRKELNAKVI